MLSNDDLSKIIQTKHSAHTIQRAWKRIITNPEYMICKRRLIREYNSMTNIDKN